MAGHITTSMKAKEKLIQESTFPPPPRSSYVEPSVWPGIAHQKATKEVIFHAFISQSTSKALGPDKINFRILNMIWEWDSKRLIAMV